MQLVVDAVRARVVRAALAQLEPALQLDVDRGGELLHLLRDQVPGQRKGGQLRVMQDLVRPRAADAGDHALVAEHRVQSPRLLRADRLERLRAEPERFGPEVRELRLGGLRRQEPHACPLLRARPR